MVMLKVACFSYDHRRVSEADTISSISSPRHVGDAHVENEMKDAAEDHVFWKKFPFVVFFLRPTTKLFQESKKQDVEGENKDMKQQM